jgi:hypothetical protein
MFLNVISEILPTMIIRFLLRGMLKANLFLGELPNLYMNITAMFFLLAVES